MEGARERFQQAQSIPEFNKQLTLVSIVGERGVGKSTVASLLSGNHSMFETGSGSVGTTTGADISTIIPTTDYASILGDHLNISLNTVTDETLPLFLIDSGDLSVLTNPLALISQVIRWPHSPHME